MSRDQPTPLEQRPHLPRHSSNQRACAPRLPNTFRALSLPPPLTMSSTTSSAPSTTSNSNTDGSASRSRTTSNRLPSLNQLAARINISNTSDPNAANGTNVSGVGSGSSEAGFPTNAPRPRLAAFALRTNSNVSLSATSASSGDSMAVNPPGTRSGSPMALSVSSVGSSTTASSVNGDGTEDGESGGEPLTSEKLEKLNEATGSNVTPIPADKKMVKGYKNIPSLDAIAKFAMQRNRTLSVDGSAKPPEPEMIEDPKTPGIQVKAPEHPLQYPWTIYHDTKAKFPFTPATASLDSASTGANSAGTGSGTAPSQPSSASFSTSEFAHHAPESTDYEAGLTVIGSFTTVEAFCRYFNWLKPPSKLERNSNYHLFKSGIKPMWEDPANANGGKWVLTMKNNPALLDRCWSWVAMALVGEELEEGADEICGAVVSLRSKVDRIQIWTRKKDDVERLNGIGKKLVKLLDVSEADGIGLEFQYNTDDRPLPNKFLSIQAMPGTGYRQSFTGPPGGGAFGALGNFGGAAGGGPVGGGVSLGGHRGPGGPGGGAGGAGGHHHSQSVGGPGAGAGGEGDGAQVQGQGQNQSGPLSAGAGTGGPGGAGFGNFGVGGPNTWRASRRG
ncbi:hypothetical protein D9758_013286 [Tetrapyrgos nigripes]|uniref:Translation initiation factor eIF4e n=2 Tax=Tetrapyrgos nigripes TaxID=182062 RepID=A0A8H5CMB6_9AGAR|nr:hypothetical protein D9758_013286 [Tetrapyrgos nigripes]